MDNKTKPAGESKKEEFMKEFWCLLFSPSKTGHAPTQVWQWIEAYAEQVRMEERLDMIKIIKLSMKFRRRLGGQDLTIIELLKILEEDSLKSKLAPADNENKD